ncbi:hypothetical protein BDR22DRAFT_827201 [Usnea florida]
MKPHEEINLRDELARTKKKAEKLESEKLLQSSELRALKIELQTHKTNLQSLTTQLHTLTSPAPQDTPFITIGQEVRLRYLSKHLQRIHRPIGPLNRERIKRGDRAAHRGRPVPDALLCLAGIVTDREVLLPSQLNLSKNSLPPPLLISQRKSPPSLPINV